VSWSYEVECHEDKGTFVDVVKLRFLEDEDDECFSFKQGDIIFILDKNDISLVFSDINVRKSSEFIKILQNNF
jgi:propanediol utilization protein